MEGDPPRKRTRAYRESLELHEKKERTFISLQKLFEKQIRDFFEPSELPNVIVCCDEEMRNKLMEFAERINKIPKYRSEKIHDIYMALIFTFYSLLGEQTEDAFGTEFLIGKGFNPRLPYELFLELTIGDLMEENGTNLSQNIRRSLLGFNGGKKRSKKSKRRKRSKRKTKRVKRY